MLDCSPLSPAVYLGTDSTQVQRSRDIVMTTVMYGLRGASFSSLLDGSDASWHPRTLHLMYNNYKRRTAAKHSEQGRAWHH